MELKLYNTLSRTKEVFVPIDPKNVRMYVCGPTVYDFAHIGNARPVIVFDVLYRLLRHVYGAEQVVYARNITDIDDKINARAAERDISIWQLTEGTYANFREDVTALGTLPPTVEPRATEHVEEMKLIIERLIANGNAYVAEEHVLFSVPSMPDYGKLSRRPLEDLIAGARVDVAPYKRGDMDFVLWKPSPEGIPGWPSPAGIKTNGRPGWHIECSAMAWKHLGETFDIHGGGIDLVFPHHENEIAQSRCAFDHGVMANVWMHNGFLQVESGEKMSKSLGNFVTIRELLTTPAFGGRAWDGSVVKFAMLQAHYRQPLGWSRKALEQAAQTLEDWFRVAKPDGGAPSAEVIAALADDLNTPQMTAALHAVRKRITANGGAAAAAELGNALAFLGFDADRFAAWLSAQRAAIRVDEAQIETLIASRTQARANKDWAESDRIRDELAAMGVVLKDSKEGTTWEVAR